MTTPTRHALSVAAPPETAPLLDPEEVREFVAPVARAILVHALLLGVAADLLLRDGLTGLGLPAWLLLLALSVLSLVWRDARRLSNEAGAWLAAATMFGAMMAWRSSSSLQFFDFLAMLSSLGMAAVSLADARAALFAARLRDTIWAGLRVVRSVAVGMLPLAFRDIALPVANRELHGRLRPVVRATVLALPLLLVFGALLRGADPVFASLVSLPAIEVDELMSHILIVGFFTWVTAGWARSALLTDPNARRAPEQLPFSIGMLDVTAALGSLIALFALFVITQLGWFFGGERFLQARTGLTAAQYAREGFFQMVWVVLLVVPVLLATRAMLRPGRALERRHTALALPLLALLGVMIVSAMLRMRLYVHYYGLTLDRFYPLVFMGWLAIVLAWLAMTVLRGRGRPFVAGAIVSGLSILVALNVIVPDVLVARVDVARTHDDATETTRGLDLTHLGSLGGEAVPIAIAAVLGAPSEVPALDVERALVAQRDRCTAADELLNRWTPSPRELARRDAAGIAWRAWNAGDAAAERVVREQAPGLRLVAHDACARARALSRLSRGVPASAPADR